jgi:peptidoglycan hydrolase-like amidase
MMRLTIAILAIFAVVVGVASRATRSYASCTGYYSDTTPPSTIRVYHNNPLKGGDYQIYTRDFKTYVKESLPLEWSVGWQQASLQSGALAVKTFAWNWVNNGPGGSVGGQCYDVDSTTAFQVWAPCPGPYCNQVVATVRS